MVQLKSIRTKFILWFLGVSLIPLIVSTFVSYNQSSKALIESERESALSLVKSKAQGMDEWLDRHMSELQLAAKTDILKSLDPERINPFLSDIKARSDVYEDINMAGANGVTIASSDGNIGIDINDRAYFQAAINGTSYYSEVLTSRATGRRVLIMSTPVHDDGGAVQAVLFASVNFESLVNSFLANEQLDNGGASGGKFLLVDEQDRFQFIDNPDMIGKSMEEAPLGDEFKEMLRLGKKESGSGTYKNLSGEESLLAYTPVTKTGYGLYLSYRMDVIVQSARSVQTFMFGVTAAAVVIALVSFFVSGTIARPILRITELVKRVAEGDLTETGENVRGNDEIGQLGRHVQEMAAKLRELIGNVGSASEQVAAASQQISASTEEIASGSSDQANAAQTMNQMLKQLSDAMASMASAAESASELNSRMVSIAQEGVAVVNASIEGMTAVNDQMRRLELDSGRIGEIIEVIDDIAEQTNLLALNAAIEAARAGEQGRGFAVVADEMRKLAERSGEATKQITEIIKGMQNSMGASVHSVSQAVEKTSQISEAFDRIQEMINESSRMAAEVAAACEQQSAQSMEALQFIETISAASEEAAAASQEAAASTQSLANLAEELNRSVSVFRVK